MKKIEAIRDQFPILSTQVRGKLLAYLDNAATSQKPIEVLEAMDRFYRTENANVRRGAHYLGECATAAYEKARVTVAKFLNAPEPAHIIFTRNTTEGINLVAVSWGAAELCPGDEIILTEAEHHANIVPWQLLAERQQATIRVAPVTDKGELDLQAFTALLGPKTKMVALTYASNVLGTIFPAKACIEAAHAVGARVLIDASQAVPHFALDVQALDADFVVFTSHKVFGPMGIGVLYGKK
ncbi:MAG TPA: aminotransferase class V-fold PLP-dependent enzyme, partial [Opitutales bacterium]|nr:aminotransferase class V-fold PLP-dependent enzyme [Opitutales bacterium]